MMKKIVFVALVALAFLDLTATAFAKEAKSSGSSSQGVEMDASLVVASAPASGFDTGLGVNFGLGVRLPQIDKNLQARVDLSYISWSATEFDVNVDYTRVPIFVGARYFIPTQNDKLKVFVEGGLELSFDSVDVVFPPFGRSSESEVHLGIVPGAGIEVKIAPNLGIVAGARWHLITDDYLTLQGGIVYHL